MHLGEMRSYSKLSVSVADSVSNQCYKSIYTISETMIISTELGLFNSCNFLGILISVLSSRPEFEIMVSIRASTFI